MKRSTRRKMEREEGLEPTAVPAKAATPNSPLAYRQGPVLALIRNSSRLPEPYRTAALIQGACKLDRTTLANLSTTDVVPTGGSALSARLGASGPVLSPTATADLVAYLRGYRAKIIGSPYLFPLPADPSKPLSVLTWKKAVEAIVEDLARAAETMSTKDSA